MKSFKKKKKTFPNLTASIFESEHLTVISLSEAAPTSATHTQTFTDRHHSHKENQLTAQLRQCVRAHEHQHFYLLIGAGPVPV